MKFADEAVVTVQAGAGGDGLASFYRGPFIPKGGPDGGDGGRGGDVVFEASSHIGTLEELALSGLIRAEDGKPGRKSRKTGRSGGHLLVKVPVGTLVIDHKSGELMVDLSADGERHVVAKGGRGGKGNCNFATSTNRAPRKATQGKPGERRALRLELKLLADVGLVGRPNAGKSTLLAALTAAKPKVADYPFTTLHPNLGVVYGPGYRRLILADIPGLAQGAAEGRGLGHRFLKHIERTRFIIILIEACEEDYTAAYNGIISELHAFSELLVDLPRMVVCSKADLLESGVADGFPFDCHISALTGRGLEELIIAMFVNLQPKSGLSVG